MLGIPEASVHDRAHSALAVLAPRQAMAVDPHRRLEIGDYLLGQQPAVADRLRTRTLLATSDPARAWAQAVAAELAPIAGSRPLPEIPIGTLTDQGAASQGPPPGGEPAWESPRQPPSSRLGGALLLAAIVAAVVVAVVLLTGGGSSSRKTTSSSSTSTGTTSAKAGTPTVEGRFPLRPPDPTSKSTGSVEVFSESGKRAFFIRAAHVPASTGFFYAIWLYNSPSSTLPLSRAPAVGKSHRLEGAALLPSNASKFHEILLTRETSSRPTHPGHVVLRGPFKVSG